jgi:hypothetical protein
MTKINAATARSHARNAREALTRVGASLRLVAMESCWSMVASRLASSRAARDKRLRLPPQIAGAPGSQRGLAMSARVRKFVGGVVMIAFVGVYALIAMALAQSRPLQEAPPLAQTLGYIALGLAWTLPLAPLIKWMERPDRRG